MKPGYRIILVLGLFLGPGALQAGAQAPSDTGGSTATLPESNEAMLLANRAVDAAERGDYRLTLELVEQIRNLSDEGGGALVPDVTQRTYLPVWREAMRLAASLPEEAVALYRQGADAEIAVRLERATAAADLAALRRLYREARLSRHWQSIGLELATQLLARGRNGEATRVLRELVRAAERPSAATGARLQLCAGYLASGSLTAARQTLDVLSLEIDPKRSPRLADRLGQLEQWYARRLRADRAGWDVSLLRGIIAPQPVWDLAVPGPHEEALLSETELAAGVIESRRLPLQRLVTTDGLLLTRVNGELLALDTLTFTERWRRKTQDRGVERMTADELERRGSDDGLGDLPVEVRRLLSAVMDFTLAAGHGMVFTIETRGVVSRQDYQDGFPGLHGGRTLEPNALVARRAADGREVWVQGDDMSDALKVVAFQGNPLVLDEGVVVAAQKDDQLHLLLLAPQTGQLLQRRLVVGPPTYFDPQGTHVQLAADDGAVYVCTGNGVIAAFTRGTLDWQWAATYPSSLSRRLGRFAWQRVVYSDSGPFNPLIVADEILVAAPADTEFILAFDRTSGEEVWRIPRDRGRSLVGATSRGVVVADYAVTCLDPQDGETILWRSVPLETTGRPVVHDDRVYLVTQDGAAVIDGRSGKLVADQAAFEDGLAVAGALRPNTPSAATIAVGEDSVWVASPTRAIKYPDPGALQQRCRERLESNPDEPEARLALAWARARAGAADAALAAAEALDPPRDSPLARSRGNLLTQLYVAKASEAPSTDARLAWLRRAIETVNDPAAGGSLAMLIGQALEENEDWTAALDYYRRLLLEEGTLLQLGRAGQVVNSRLMGVQSARRLLSRCTPEQRDAFVDSLLEAAWKSDAPALGLQYALAALEGTDRAADAARMLMLRTLPVGELSVAEAYPPELMALHLPRPPAAGNEHWPVRRLHLTRWYVHSSLGDLIAAEADQRRWAEVVSAAPRRDGLLFPELTAEQEEDILYEIQAAMRKLARLSGPEFDASLRRQYGVDARILPRARPAPVDDWVVVVQEGGVLGPMHLGRGRRFDSIPLGTVDQFAARESVAASGPWFVIQHDRLAATVLDGRIIAFGTAPEQTGGRKLWEFTGPIDTARTLGQVRRHVAGPRGVYATLGNSRIVCLDWLSGEVCWRYDFEAFPIERLELTGDSLVVIGDGGDLAVLDAELGGQPKSAHADRGPVLVADDVLAVATERGVVGLNPRTLRKRWVVDARVRAWAAPPGGGIALGLLGNGVGWVVIDLETGAALASETLGEFDRIDACAVRGDRLLVGGDVLGQMALRKDSPLGLAALDMSDWSVVWRYSTDTVVPLNYTQLSAGRGLIPLLVAPSTSNRTFARMQQGAPDEVANLSSARLELIDMRTGERVAAEPIGEQHGLPEQGRAWLYVTPRRVVVVAGERLMAFGNSSLSRGR